MQNYPQTRRELEIWLEAKDYQMEVKPTTTIISKNQQPLVKLSNQYPGKMDIEAPLSDELALVLIKYSKIATNQRQQYHKIQKLPLPDVQTLTNWDLKPLKNPATTHLKVDNDQLSTLHHLQRQFKEGRWIEK